MKGIDPEIMSHRHNVDPKFLPKRQKRVHHGGSLFQLDIKSSIGEKTEWEVAHMCRF